MGIMMETFLSMHKCWRSCPKKRDFIQEEFHDDNNVEPRASVDHPRGTVKNRVMGVIHFVVVAVVMIPMVSAVMLALSFFRDPPPKHAAEHGYNVKTPSPTPRLQQALTCDPDYRERDGQLNY